MNNVNQDDVIQGPASPDVQQGPGRALRRTSLGPLAKLSYEGRGVSCIHVNSLKSALAVWLREAICLLWKQTLKYLGVKGLI